MAGGADAAGADLLDRAIERGAPAPDDRPGRRDPFATAADALLADLRGHQDSPGRLDAFLEADTVSAKLAIWFGEPLGLGQADARDRLLFALDRAIAGIDDLLSRQVDAVLHHPRFQALEASWRGVVMLVTEAEKQDNMRVRLLSATWAEVCRDLESAAEFDQSGLFKKIYEEEFGMPGGVPFAVMVGDYEVQHRPSKSHRTDDVAGLRGMAGIAAAAFCPFLVSASPTLFGLDSFRDFELPFDLERIFRQPEYTRWTSMQDLEDVRFVGVTLPRTLMRLPYADDGSIDVGFRYKEDVSAPDGSGHLWGNAAYAFTTILARAFADAGWFAEIRGTPKDMEAGGIVNALPVPSFETDAPGVAMKYSTDVSLSDRHEKALADLGFVPLSKAKDTPYSVFYSNASLQRPKVYDRAIASANARLSTMLQYMFCTARFAHCLKVMAREKVGSFQEASDIETQMQRWLHGFCSASDSMSLDMRARYPLREGTVQVRESLGKPGSYNCTFHLQPHFQLDQIVSTFKLTTELPAKRGS